MLILPIGCVFLRDWQVLPSYYPKSRVEKARLQSTQAFNLHAVPVPQLVCYVFAHRHHNALNHTFVVHTMEVVASFHEFVELQLSPSLQPVICAC